jgi:hypothetical protein
VVMLTPPADPDRPREGSGRCNVKGCGAVGPVEPEAQAQARMVWHVYRSHPELWRMLHNGANPAPDVPRPDR